MDILAIALMIMGTVITFGLFSILTGKDNPFFAFSEYSYIGASIGLMTVMAVAYLQQKVFDPIIKNPAGQIGLIVGVVLGALVLLRVSSRYAYIARIPITIGIAIGVGISTRTIVFTDIVAQVKATILPLWSANWLTAATNILIIVFVSCSLLFFMYTTKTTGPGVKQAATIGRYILYAGFGALFAQTFMGRIGLFLGRMDTMLNTTTQLYTTIIVIVVILAVIAYLSKKPELMSKLLPASQ